MVVLGDCLFSGGAGFQRIELNLRMLYTEFSKYGRAF